MMASMLEIWWLAALVIFLALATLGFIHGTNPNSALRRLAARLFPPRDGRRRS